MTDQNDLQNIANSDEIFQFVAEKKHIGKRLDAVLAQLLPQISRSRLKALIKSDQVTVDQQTITSPNHRLKLDNQIKIELPPLEDPDPEAEDIPLNIIYEDEDLIVINKAPNMVVHPAPGNWSGTLVNALLHHCKGTLSGINGVKRPGIVHRLDKETSGLMVAAKNDMAHKHLAEQFADHGRTNNLERAYQAIIWGAPQKPSLKIVTRIGRSTANRLKMAVLKNQQAGRHAITHYKIVRPLTAQDKKGNPVASLVECRLETGRTHQIRVHMSHLGHPLLGDPLYGTAYQNSISKLSMPAQSALSALKRQALHAKMLGFDHPRTGEHLKFESDLPDDMQTLLSAIETD